MTDTLISSATREVVIGFERPFVMIVGVPIRDQSRQQNRHAPRHRQQAECGETRGAERDDRGPKDQPGDVRPPAKGKPDGTRYLSTPEGRSLSRLNTGLAALLSALDTADAAPTTQEVSMFSELEKALQEQLTAWEQLKSKDIPELNEQLKKTGLPEIDLKKSAPASTDGAQTTLQDRDKNEE